ncbi:hypothetical protein WA171_000808 [Blastocystis sp. BT1]
MSTAHKPTWSPAAGRSSGNGNITAGGYLTGGSLSMHFSAKDLPGHLNLKMREVIPEIKAPGDVKTKPKEEEKKEEKKELPLALQEPEPQKDDDFGDFDDSDESDSASSSSEESESEDEDALLMAELARVKKEKELARQKEAEEKAQMEAALNREEMLHSNPLMFSSEDSTLKRRWDDDVLFLNQGKTEKRKKRFINDTIRNDFHVNFMNSVFK